jgi:gentisate 1,2-dioxygenase
MRWSVNWVGDQADVSNHNPHTAIHNPKIAIGMTVLEPGHSCPGDPLPKSRLYLVIEGEAITCVGDNATILGHLDGLHLPPRGSAKLRNNGPRPLRLLWVDCPG